MNSDPSMNAPHQPSDWVGQALPRESARRYVAGRGRYTDDVRLAGLLHAAFLRSPWASARWSAPNLSAARALPGVRGVWQASDLAGICHSWTTALATLPQHRSAAQGPLADGQSHWQGQPVVLVTESGPPLVQHQALLEQVSVDFGLRHLGTAGVIRRCAVRWKARAVHAHQAAAGGREGARFDGPYPRIAGLQANEGERPRHGISR
jgi:xanthine dehydrogenase molybdopterin-binding subunit B